MNAKTHLSPSTPSGTDTSRRGFIKSTLIVSAGCFVSALPLPSLAHSVIAGSDPLRQFISVTQTITEHKHIDSQLAAHFFQVFAKQQADFVTRLQQLTKLISPSISANDFLQAADQQGLKTFLQEIVTAWYTGTIGNDYHGTLVSYKQALMYDVVSDGLVVPTYCGNGPLWWTAPVPDADSHTVIDAL